MSTFENTVDIVGDVALTNSIISRSLTEIVDSSITTIGEQAFSYNANLITVIFQKATRVKTNAFGDCRALTKADFSSCVSFETNVFYNLKNLTALILRSDTICSCTSGTFGLSSALHNGTGYIYVPSALVDSYKAATNWSTFADQIRAIEDYPEVCDPYT